MRQHDGCWLCILVCADDSFYVGTTRLDLDARLSEHNSGLRGGYTFARRPVRVVFAEHFQAITDAIAAERRIKGWSRAKKQTLIDGRWEKLPELARRRLPFSTRPLLRDGPDGPPQDEG